MANVCGDNRFEVIAMAKEALLDSTNISESPNEMKVLNNFLFRCWQMGWLDRYERELAEQQSLPIVPILHGNVAPTSREEAMKRLKLRDKLAELKGGE